VPSHSTHVAERLGIDQFSKISRAQAAEFSKFRLTAKGLYSG
jgi:hypothetical protein